MIFAIWFFVGVFSYFLCKYLIYTLDQERCEYTVRDVILALIFSFVGFVYLFAIIILLIIMVLYNKTMDVKLKDIYNKLFNK